MACDLPIASAMAWDPLHRSRTLPADDWSPADPGSHVSYAVRFISITDAIAVCMLTVPWLVTVLPVRERLLLGGATFFLSTLGSMLWEPTGHSRSSSGTTATSHGTVSMQTATASVIEMNRTGYHTCAARISR